MGGRVVWLLLLVPLAVRALFVPFFALTYDEVSYAWIAQRLADSGGWLGFQGPDDAFFWPPLFPYLAAPWIALGVDRVIAVRLVTVLMSSAIPPLLYLLVQRTGHGAKAALLTALLWVLSPWAFRFSVVGQVETPMLALVLLAVFLLQRARDDGRLRTAVWCAASLGAAVWIKETALGLAPLFPLFLWRVRRQAAAWALVFAALLAPHLVQNFLPHTFGVFFELTNPFASWNHVNPDAVLGNLLRLQGIEPLGPGGFGLAIAVAVAVTFVLAVRELWNDIRRGDALLRFCGLALAVFGVFFALFWKRFVYYALPLHLFLAPFLGIYLARVRVWRWVFLAFVALSFAATLPRFARRGEERSCLQALRVIETQRRGASIGMPLPRLAEYLAERERIAVRVSPKDWVACLDESSDCLLDHEYLAGSSESLRRAFVGIYCRSTTVYAGCDRAGMNELVERLHYVTGNDGFRVYRLEPR
ncbi:MAG: glycosyltransferase family 39 protein [Deltaproteobacteria bacterium]|nr:glycosyltransferase family 39 protein [Deltaproteobacteria bacterium]